MCTKKPRFHREAHSALRQLLLALSQVRIKHDWTIHHLLYQLLIREFPLEHLGCLGLEDREGHTSEPFASVSIILQC